MNTIIKTLTLCLGLVCFAVNAHAVESFFVTLKKTANAPTDLKEKILHVGIGNCLPFEAADLGYDVVVYRTDCDDQSYFLKALSEVIKVPGVERVIAIGFPGRS